MSIHLTPARTDSALAHLCSAAPDVFAESIWARRAWLSHSSDLPDHDELFSLAAVDELLSRRGLRTPFLRMAKDGKVVPPARFTGSGGIGATIADQVHDEDVLRLFADGSTIVLQGLHRTWDPVGGLAARLSAELGHPVQVNAYITPAQSQGFSAHYDTHDVFVLQIAGHKQWLVHEPVIPLADRPWDTVADDVAQRALEQPVLAATLEPGDCLYLPRGFIHSAVALGATSVHLTFGIHAVTEAQVVAAVLDQVRDGDWRASMPAGWDPADSADLLVEVIERIRRTLDDVDVKQVADALIDRRASAQRPEPLSPVAQAEAAAQLRPDQTVRLRRFFEVRITGQGLQLPSGRHVPVDDSDLPALHMLLTGHPVNVQDLPCDPATIAGLLREGVLVIATEP